MPGRALIAGALLAGACSAPPGDTGDTPAPAPLPPPALAPHASVPSIIVASWEMERGLEACWLRWSLDGLAWQQTPRRACPAGEQRQLLLGVPAGAKARVQIVAEERGIQRRGPGQTVRAAPLPSPQLQPQLDAWVPGSSSEAPWLLLALERDDGGYYDGPYWQIILDRRGRVVWYHQLDDGLSSTFPTVAASGDHLVSERLDRFGLAGDQPPVIQRRSLDLSTQQEHEAPGLRFAWGEAPDGSIYYFDREQDDEGWLSRLDPQGQRERIFDCATWIRDRCTDTWCCETNAVVVQPDRGSVLMSLWASDTVLEIDTSTHELRHVWGQLEGAWTTEPAEAGFDLQHYPTVTAEGTLLLTTHVPGQPGQHRVREYSLDEQAQALVQRWSWGEGQELFARYQGEALRLDNGNTLMNFGTAAAIREHHPEHGIVWSLTWSEPWLLGHMTPIQDLYPLLDGP